MIRILLLLAMTCSLSPVTLLCAQGLEAVGATEFATVSVGRPRIHADIGGSWGGVATLEARHWAGTPAGSWLNKFGLGAVVRIFAADIPDERQIFLRDCDTARKAYVERGSLPAADSLLAKQGCGQLFYTGGGRNLITSAGKTLVSQLLGKISSPPAQANYIALTNTAITPAVADTTLTAEIAANGLSRAQGVFTDTSAAIGTPPTPATPTTVGTTGAATLFYWVFACTSQGCTAVGSSSTLSTANATLTTGNYVSVTWTGKTGASYYVVLRTQGAGAPSGAIAGGSTQATTGQVTNNAFCSVPVAGTAPTCTIYDQSNNTVAATFGPNGTSTTVPAADQTFSGAFTLTKTFTCTTANQAAQAFGIFNASSSGTMLSEGTFASASLQASTSDTLAFTYTFYHP